jgi:hypothetical protein
MEIFHRCCKKIHLENVSTLTGGISDDVNESTAANGDGTTTQFVNLQVSDML